MAQVGDWVTIRDDAPGSQPGMWVEKSMRLLADGFCMYRIIKLDYGWATLENPYGHSPDGHLNAATFVWHESWLQKASAASSANSNGRYYPVMNMTGQAGTPQQAPSSAAGSGATPAPNPQSAGVIEAVKEALTGDKGKPEGDKPQRMVYSDRHEIIPQNPGESDKAYLRRILGGR